MLPTKLLSGPSGKHLIYIYIMRIIFSIIELRVHGE